MTFSAAFRYPFQNFAKVLSIVLVLTIAFAACIGLLLNSQDWSQLTECITGQHSSCLAPIFIADATALLGLLGLVVVAVAQGFWLSGYSVETIRALMHGDESLPALKMSRNIKDGFYLFLSSVAYWLLFAGALGAFALLISWTQASGLYGAILIFAAISTGLFLACVFGWAYFIGMARFAIERDYRTCWQLRRNLRLARQQPRAGSALLFYMLVLSIVYGAFRSVVEVVLGGFVGSGLMTSIALTIIVYYFFNLMQHLIAQYALAVKIGDDYYNPKKDKVDRF